MIFNLFAEDNPQFAYLQLGTIITTFIRRVELRLEGDKFPAHNYHVSCIAYYDCYKDTFVTPYFCLDHDYHT